MIEIIRVKLTSMIEGALKRFTATGRAGETFTVPREALQHYGFTSRAKAGAEGLVLVQNGVVYLIAEDDRRYRLAIEEGEVALYSDEGDYIRFMRGRVLKVHTGGKLIAEATESAELTTKAAKVTATASVEAVAPKITLNADTEFKVGSAVINLGEAVKALVDARFLALYNAHAHGPDQLPIVKLTPADCCTVKVKGE